MAKKFIAAAIKRTGALRKKLGVSKKTGKILVKKLVKAGAKLRKRLSKRKKK